MDYREISEGPNKPGKDAPIMVYKFLTNKQLSALQRQLRRSKLELTCERGHYACGCSNAKNMDGYAPCSIEVWRELERRKAPPNSIIIFADWSGERAAGLRAGSEQVTITFKYQKPTDNDSIEYWKDAVKDYYDGANVEVF